MASEAKTGEERGAESPTTARPLDFDDEQETGVVDASGQSHQTPTKPPRSSSLNPHNVRFAEDEQPPPKPPRPASPNTQNEQMLVEAFPGIERQVIKAVLVASNGQVEPAFNALLSMSDPDHADEAPPPQPPRPTAQTQQLEQDELYARQLAEHYATVGQRQRGQQQQQQRPQRRPSDSREGDHEYSFFDDDLPRIRENMRQGFLTTQTRFNSWITDLRKRIDGDETEGGEPGQSQPPRQNFGPSQHEQMIGIQRQAERQRQQQQQQQQGGGGPYPSQYNRRSTDQERYDADPRVLSDNFAELEMHDAEAAEQPPKKPARPAANPDLFKPTPATPKGPIDEVDAALYAMPTGAASNGAAGGAKSKKWQPLTSIAPNPEADDNDPFSLGDSDDEKSKSEDVRKDDTERLKARAASVSQDATKQPEKKLEAAEHSGSVGHRDKAAEELLKDDAAKSEAGKAETAVAEPKEEAKEEAK